MILINELRIGNWVNNWAMGTKVPVQITLFHFQYFESLRGALEGIRLTPEILEACGFTLDASYPIPLWQDKCGFYFSDAWFTEYPHYSLRLMNRFDLKIDCLHQLQNLYFALTGQELEVNLPANQTT